LTAPWLKRESGAAGAWVESVPLIPAPPVAVIDPEEREPFSATLRATIELLAALVMKYMAFGSDVTGIVEFIPFPLLPPFLVEHADARDMAWVKFMDWPPTVIV
jgi:hypothetical protein